jgi:hypothetical protein
MRIVPSRGKFRRLAAVALALGLMFLAGAPAQAFWPFGGGRDVGSGLDFDRGYDANTVTTIGGIVVSLTTNEGGGPALIEIKTSSGAINLVIGPQWYWKENGIAVRVGDEITARGAKAEGKDGRMYLLAQKLSNQSSGDSLVLRSEDGMAAWSWMNRSQDHGRPAGGAQVPRTGPRPGGGQGRQRGR